MAALMSMGPEAAAATGAAAGAVSSPSTSDMLSSSMRVLKEYHGMINNKGTNTK
jgi:hypothetical protein